MYLDWENHIVFFLLNIYMFKLSEYSLPDIMDLPLPSISNQKRLLFRPTLNDARHVYMLLNEKVFYSELHMPDIYIMPRRRKYWGMCLGDILPYETGSLCEIELMDKWFCPQWFVTVIAHEMAHQHQWDVEGPKRYRKGKAFLMSHGPTFFRFRDRMKRYGIPLKTSHSMRKWFKHQDLFKA